MSIKKTKNTLDNRANTCSYCDAPAIWVALGCVSGKKYSCVAHFPDLHIYYIGAVKLPRENDNGYRSEADNQTWMKV